MRTRLNLLFLKFRYLYSRLIQGLVEKQLRKRFVAINPSQVDVQWKLKYDEQDIYGIFDYKDEDWNQVVNLDVLMLMHSFGLYKGEKRSFIPIDENNRKIYKDIENHLKVSSQGLSNDWIYLTTYHKEFCNCRLSVTIRFDSIFKEFQIAYRHHSLFERLRFRIVDGNEIVSEVVTKGFFSNPIHKIPFALEISKVYKIDLYCIDGNYSFAINDEVKMTIRDTKYEKEQGELAIVFWDDKPQSNIRAEMLHYGIYEINNQAI